MKWRSRHVLVINGHVDKSFVFLFSKKSILKPSMQPNSKVLSRKGSSVPGKTRTSLSTESSWDREKIGERMRQVRLILWVAPWKTDLNCFFSLVKKKENVLFSLMSLVLLGVLPNRHHHYRRHNSFQIDAPPCMHPGSLFSNSPVLFFLLARPKKANAAWEQVLWQPWERVMSWQRKRFGCLHCRIEKLTWGCMFIFNVLKSMHDKRFLLNSSNPRNEALFIIQDKTRFVHFQCLEEHARQEILAHLIQST